MPNTYKITMKDIMKKTYKFLYLIGILAIIGFIIRLGADYFKYDKINNSSPFYVLIIERVFEFIIPSIILFITGSIIKKGEINYE